MSPTKKGALSEERTPGWGDAVVRNCGEGKETDTSPRPLVRDYSIGSLLSFWGHLLPATVLAESRIMLFWFIKACLVDAC